MIACIGIVGQDRVHPVIIKLAVLCILVQRFIPVWVFMAVHHTRLP